MVVDINFELVINTGFHSDLLNRSSEKFIEMERNIISKVSKGYLAVDLRFRHSFSLVLGALLWTLNCLVRILVYCFDKNNKTAVALQINIQFNESSLFKIYEVRVLNFR